MAVARIHGKVKCRRFKEKKEEVTAYKARHHRRWPLCFTFSFPFFEISIFYFTKVVRCARKRAGQLQFSALVPSTWKQAAMVGSSQRPNAV